MSDFWYALAAHISADAFAPLGHPAGPAQRERRSDAPCAARRERTPRQTQAVVELGRPRTLEQLPCMQ